MSGDTSLLNRAPAMAKIGITWCHGRRAHVHQPMRLSNTPSARRIPRTTPVVFHGVNGYHGREIVRPMYHTVRLTDQSSPRTSLDFASS